MNVSVRALITSGTPRSSAIARIARDLRRCVLDRQQPPGMLPGRVAAIFDVETDRADLEDTPRRLCGVVDAVAVSRFDLDGYTDGNGGNDSLDHAEHLVARDDLPVGIAEAGRDRRARRSECNRFATRDQTSRRHIEGVRQHDDRATRVRCGEFGSTSRLPIGCK
jgi:hypothetical protein